MTRTASRAVTGVGLALALLAIAYAALELTSLLWWRNADDTVGSYQATKVRIDAGCGDVSVSAAAPGSTEVVVRRSSRWTFRRGDTTAVLNDGVLTVTSGCSSSPPNLVLDESVQVLLPPDLPVQVIGGGDVSLDGLSGAVSVQGSHDVRGDGLRSPSVVVTADSGGVVLRFAIAPHDLLAEADSGDIDVTVPRDDATYHVSAQSTSGDVSIDVRTDPASPRTVTLRAMSGDLSVRYPG
jgi:hypothetical protein